MDKLVLKFDQLKETLSAVNKPLLIIHPKPDIDALGSAFALAEFFREKYDYFPDIFSIDQPGKESHSLFPIEKLTYKIDFKKYDSVIFLDRVDLYYRLGFENKIKNLKKNYPILAIDHHPNSFIPGALMVLDTKASATSEILYRFFDHIDFPFDKKIAQYLLGGVYDDTGGFRHDNTTPKALEVSSALLRKGASINIVNRALSSNKSLGEMNLWGIALDRAQINPKTGMVVSFITKEDMERCGATTNDVGLISEILNTISDSKFSLVLSQKTDDRIKASLRSEKYKKVDVSKIAQKFKGGGHKLASGFEIKGRLRQVGDSWIIE